MVEKRVKTEPAQNEVESKKAKWSKKTDVKKDIKKEFKGEFKGKKDFKKGDKKPFNKNKKDFKGKKETEEEKKERDAKAIKRERQRREDPNFDLRCELKKLWEKLRNAEKASEKEEFVNTIFDKIRNSEKANFLDFAYAHDTTRVLQSCLQHGTAAQRRVVYEEVKLKVAEMAQSKYARNMVLKLIKYGERDIKDYCIENMGNIRKLVRSSFGQSILEYAYNQFAQAGQRNGIVSTMYGKSYVKLSKMETNPTLITVIEKNPDFMETILKDFMDDLKALTEKEVMKQTVSHRAFLDFFNLCLYLLSSPKFADKRKKIEEIREELIDDLKASVIHMIHTPDGAKAGLHCLWFGSAKDRKLILKTMKEFLEKVATSDAGYLLILGAIDSVDDTVLVRKQLILPLCKDIDKLISDPVARKIFWYILSPRDRRAFLPDQIKLLEVGDETTTSKKPRQVKHEEIQSSAVPLILEWISENIDTILNNPMHLPILYAAFDHSDESQIIKDKENMLVTAQRALARKFNTVYDESHMLHGKGVAMTLKKVLRLDKVREEFKFSKVFVEECTKLLPKLLTDNRGCFLLLQLVEAEDKDVIGLIKEEIGEELSRTKSDVKKTKGGELLIETGVFSL